MDMQILQWLSKVTCEPSKETTHDSCKKTNSANRRGIYRKLKRVEESKLGCGSFKSSTLLCSKDIAKACFHSTVNLHRLRSYQRHPHWNHSMIMKKGDIARGLGTPQKAADCVSHGGNKVLPITDAALSTQSNKSDQCGTSDKKDRSREGKNRSQTLSRMKELLRWAAAVKSEKGRKFMSRKVLHFHKNGAIKGAQEDNHISNESPKISFTWDAESCSTITSAMSLPSMRKDHIGSVLSVNSTPARSSDLACCRRGNWITTDSEFVVLEL